MTFKSESSFLFWQKWLFYSSLIFAFAGIAFALLGDNFLIHPYNVMLSKALWGGSTFMPETVQFRSFIYAPLGGTIACCYILVAFIARYPFKNKERWARNGIMIAFGVWVIIDSSVCIYFGVYAQVYLINAFSIAIKALPIIFTWKQFPLQAKLSRNYSQT